MVRSSRGIEHPVYFGKGETQKILSLFGVPSSDNPELLEAIEYNKHYPMYLVSPTNHGLNGGIPDWRCRFCDFGCRYFRG